MDLVVDRRSFGIQAHKRSSSATVNVFIIEADGGYKLADAVAATCQHQLSSKADGESAISGGVRQIPNTRGIYGASFFSLTPPCTLDPDLATLTSSAFPSTLGNEVLPPTWSLAFRSSSGKPTQTESEKRYSNIANLTVCYLERLYEEELYAYKIC